MHARLPIPCPTDLATPSWMTLICMALGSTVGLESHLDRMIERLEVTT